MFALLTAVRTGSTPETLLEQAEEQLMKSRLAFSKAAVAADDERQRLSDVNKALQEQITRNNERANEVRALQLKANSRV